MIKKSQNLNNSYYESLDKNFNEALKLFEQKLTQEEILNHLSNGNLLQKQIAALKISKINNFREAEILAQNLTGQDGKIREAVSLKINELIEAPDYAIFFKTESIYDILLEALTDVNPNVCRNIICTIILLKNDTEFSKYFTDNLIKKTQFLINKIENTETDNSKYKTNKEVFKLYWCLEAISELYDNIDNKSIKEIVTKTFEINEYTIREKTAKILSQNYTDTDLITISNKLKEDTNYYVRQY